MIHVLLSSCWSDYTHNITSKNNNNKRKVWAGTLPPAARLLKHEADFGRSHLPSNCHSTFWSGVGLLCKTQAFCLCLSTCTWRTKREATNACFHLDPKSWEFHQGLSFLPHVSFHSREESWDSSPPPVPNGHPWKRESLWKPAWTLPGRLQRLLFEMLCGSSWSSPIWTRALGAPSWYYRMDWVFPELHISSKCEHCRSSPLSHDGDECMGCSKTPKSQTKSWFSMHKLTLRQDQIHPGLWRVLFPTSGLLHEAPTRPRLANPWAPKSLVNSVEGLLLQAIETPSALLAWW